MTGSSTLRDTEWASQTCTLSFETIGIWPDGADGTDVNVANRSQDKTLLATGDDFGKVKLYQYPASKPKVSRAQLNVPLSRVTLNFIINFSRFRTHTADIPVTLHPLDSFTTILA